MDWPDAQSAERLTLEELPHACVVHDYSHFHVSLPAMCTGEAGALLPVIATMLRFSPAELTRCKAALARFAGEAESNARDSGAGDYSGYFSGWGSWLGSESSPDGGQ